MLTNSALATSVSLEAAHRRLMSLDGRGLETPQAPAGRRPPLRRYPKGAHMSSEARGLIVSGWASQARLMEGGERHVFGLLLPGDIVCTDEHCAASLTRIFALSNVEVADIASVGAMIDDATGFLSGAEWRLAEARYLDQMMRLSALNAQRAMGHLLLELHDRLASVGLVRDGRFHMPIGQRVLASVLGLSAVHVNRTLQQLTREGLVASGAGWMSIEDRARLAEIVACRSSFSHLAFS